MVDAAASGTRHIALLVETSNAYARGILGGVRDYLAGKRGWSIYLGEHGRHDTDLSWLDGWHGDGVLVRVENQQIADQIRRLDLPAVDLSAAGLAPELSCVETDDDMIAAWALEHFTERGLKNLAFCGDSRFGWSVKRRDRFVARAAERGLEVDAFELDTGDTVADNRVRLAAWLGRLPQPVGVFACYDIAGQEVLEACKIAGLAVPDSVAVLGVDNDELICNLTSPPLSSVQSDSARTGYVAAELLDAMMSGHRAAPQLHLIEPLRIVARQSSDILSVNDPLVAKALRHIRDNADHNLPVTAVLRHVGLSRRSLDYRFIRAFGRTVHDEIVRVRMERIATLLGSTDWTLPQIAEHLDFSHAEYMGVAFKKHVGKSPGEYRKAIRSNAARA